MHPVAIRSKLPTTGTTIFTVMTQLAKQHQAINLAQGFPSFSCDTLLMELVNKYMKKGYNQYAHMAGILPLREAIADKIASSYALNVQPESDITITAGGTQAIYTAITAFIRENDEVIIFEPAYDSYKPAIKLSGGRPVFVQLKSPDYRIPWQDVKKAINSQTRMIILNTPHNPTGMVWRSEDMEELKQIVHNSNIILLSDEVYEHIVFDGHQHQSILRYPELFERSLVVFSFGKTFHSTGWKVGYCVAPAYLSKELRLIHQFNIFSVNTPVQYAFTEYLQNKNHYLELADFYQQKRDYFLKTIQSSRFTYTPTQGTYFQTLNYANISDEKDMDFATRLTKEMGVAAIPISAFYNNKLDEKQLRFCFAKDENTLQKAGDLLSAL